MKRLLFLLIGLLLLTSVQATNENERMMGFLKNLSTYNHSYTREQVYLHLDNNGYFEGETIWFNANVVFASNLRPTYMSHVLYVELLNSAGDIMQRKRLHIKNGCAAGEFQLNDLVHSGYYEIRAYTRAMLNWDAASIFSRVVPVFARPKENGDYRNLECYDVYHLYTSRPKTTAFQLDSAETERGVTLGLFPEGGNVVGGFPSQVAYKLTDKRGFSLSDTLRVFTGGGELLTTSVPEHQGMGSFVLPATAGEGCYVEVRNSKNKTARFALPSPQSEGVTLHTEAKDTVSLLLKINGSRRFQQQLLGVSIECRGRTCYFDTLRIGDAPAYVVVPFRNLGQGVNQVTLFNADGQILAERRVWGGAAEPLRLEVQQNARRYGPYQPIVLNMKLTDLKHQPRRSRFSLSVRDQGGEVVARASGVRENLLLGSDIKGYISNPDYYFESADEQHRRALDLLLQVQGWRRYDWQEMAGAKPFVLKQPVETGMLIDGKLVDTKMHPIPNFKIDTQIVLFGNNELKGKTVTDSLGNFSFLSPSFYGEGMCIFSARDNKKRKFSYFALNRRFSPQPRGLYSQEIALRPPVFGENNVLTEPPVFQWNDTIKTDIRLGEATVYGKELEDLFGGRYSWGGGEATGRHYADIYYNANEELEKYLDRGEETPTIWQWLEERNSDFMYTFGDGERSLTYRGRPVTVIVDNNYGISQMPQYMDEIRSIMITTRPEVYNRFFPGSATVRQDNVLIFLYSDPMMNIFDHRRSERITQLHGYVSAAEFYSPQYGQNSLPDSKDFRRTLYWNPDVVTDSEGRAQVQLYSNARSAQRICISAQGVSPDGSFVDLE